jgi:uncharacterized protein (DUF58 family)
VLSRRGLGLVSGSLIVALVGLAYGVEEFVLVAVAAGALLAAGMLLLVCQVHRARLALRVEVVRPPAHVGVDGRASAVVEGSDRGSRPVPALWLEGARRWQVSFPGLAVRRLPPPVTSSAVAAQAGTRLRKILGISSWDGGWLALPALAPGARWRVPVAVPTESRGLWTLTPIGVWCTDPLGLVRWRVAWSPPAQVVVLPTALAVGTEQPPPYEPAGRRLGSGAEELSDPVSLGGDEFAGIRPYQAGDHFTRLHWPALARTGELLTRAFDELPERRVLLFVDTRPWKVEGSVSAAAGTGSAALAGGAAVELRTSAGERTAVAPGPAGQATLLYSLALVAPTSPTSNRDGPADRRAESFGSLVR